MVETFFAVVIGFVIGAAAGALSAFVGWNKSGEPFDTRKFVSGLVTGIITGLVFVVGLASSITDAVDQTALVLIYITIFVGIVGVDNLRTGVSQSITKSRDNNEQKAEAK